MAKKILMMSDVSRKDYLKSLALPILIGGLSTIALNILPIGESWTMERAISTPFFFISAYCILWWFRNLCNFRLSIFRFPTKTLMEYAEIKASKG